MLESPPLRLLPRSWLSGFCFLVCHPEQRRRILRRVIVIVMVLAYKILRFTQDDKVANIVCEKVTHKVSQGHARE